MYSQIFYKNGLKQAWKLHYIIMWRKELGTDFVSVLYILDVVLEYCKLGTKRRIHKKLSDIRYRYRTYYVGISAAVIRGKTEKGEEKNGEENIKEKRKDTRDTTD